MGQSKHSSKHSSIDAHWPIVAVNTSHDAPRQPLRMLTEIWHNPQCPHQKNFAKYESTPMHLQWEYAYVKDEA